MVRNAVDVDENRRLPSGLAQCKYCDSAVTPGTQCDSCGSRAAPVPNKKPSRPDLSLEDAYGRPMRPPKPQPEYMRD